MAEVCTPRSLPRHLWVEAAKTAVRINPVNHPRLERLTRVMPSFALSPERIAVVTTKYWRSGPVRLSVQFLDGPEPELRRKILSHMNAWDRTCDVRFTETKSTGDVRLARERDGYWSYVGTDIKHIPLNQQTMNLEEFTLDTPDSEFHRVVRHETGHTLGCPHEHMRKELVDLIDRDKAIAFFWETQHWSEQEVEQQVLTPIEESSLLSTEHADPRSIMCYQIPGSITRNGKPILGGTDIDHMDYEFMGTIYPKPGQPSGSSTGTSAVGTSGLDTGASRPTSDGDRGGVVYFRPGTDPQYIAQVIASMRDT